MDRRFGFKDLLIVLLMVAVIIVILLAMKQSDRQQKVLLDIERTLRSQTGELGEMNRTVRRALARAPVVVNTTQPATTQQVAGVDGGGDEDVIEPSPKGNPFHLLKAAEARPDFARGDWLVENFGVKFNRLTPFGTTGDLYGTILRARVQESLIYRDPASLDYLPLLARDWQIKDNSEAWNAYVKPLRDKGLTQDQIVEELEKDTKAPPALEITFQLRRNITFSDGHPFTADDCVFTFRWIMNPDVEAPRERAYVKTNIKDVVKVNDYEVKYLFKQPYFEALDLAGTIDVLPKHFYEPFGPKKFNQSPGLLLGTGPFMLKDPAAWTPGSPVELFRNDRYWGTPPTFDRIVYREVEGDTAELVEFQNGSVDRFSCQPDQYQELLKNQPLVARTHHIEFDTPDGGYTFVAWNQMRAGKKTPFADKRVRQAMTLLSNRALMAQQIMLGYATVATGPFTRLAKQADPSIQPWPYDTDRAKKLLAEAGYIDRDNDGVVESPDGTPFRFKLTYNSKNELSKRIALFLKDNYAEAKVAMDPEPTDWTIMLKNMDSRNFDAITLGWSGGIETDIFQMFHSSQIKDTGDNYMNYVNSELDVAIDQARTTLDESKRLPVWHKCHQILHDDQPYTFLFERKGLVFIDQRFQNVGQSKLGLNYTQRYVQPIPWYVPRERQKWKG